MSEAENQSGADGLVQPYWHLTNQDLPKGFVATLSRVRLASTAVIAIIRLAVPRQALIVFGLQLLIGATVTLSLILINKIFQSLFSSGLVFPSF
jgi:hypothetical protein